MRFFKWVGCWFVSYIALMIFSGVFMGGAYMMLLPIIAPIVGSILYRATTRPHEMLDPAE